MVNYDSSNQDDFLLSGKVPENLDCEIIDNENANQEKNAKLKIFFSFDIVNSTKYKSLTNRWPIILKSVLELIQKKVNQSLDYSLLWRVIGDEIVFVKIINNIVDLKDTIREIFSITQEISASLKKGTFFEGIEDQEITKNEIYMLRVNNLLSIKSTAWLAAINTVIENPYDNIKLEYTNCHNGCEILEYMGRDMDTGFRLKEYTQDRRLAISFEIAYLLLKSEDSINLQIIDYRKLKGVWNENLYPIIWYYDYKTAKFYNQMKEDPDYIKKINDKKNKSRKLFHESFRYDEAINNELLENYFYKDKVSKYKLADRMYTNVKEALNKILNDRNLEEKIKYYISLLDDNSLLDDKFHQHDPIMKYPKGLVVHCSVICCDVINRRIFIAERNSKHEKNNEKWEFGSPEIKGSSRLVEEIKHYYHEKFGLDIELVLDDEREDKQPIPIAIYEVEKDKHNIEKGILMIGKIVNDVQKIDFRKDGRHKSIKFISEEEIDDYKKDEVIPDFHNTLKKVFNNFDKYFPERKT